MEDCFLFFRGGVKLNEKEVTLRPMHYTDLCAVVVHGVE